MSRNLKYIKSMFIHPFNPVCRTIAGEVVDQLNKEREIDDAIASIQNSNLVFFSFFLLHHV